MKISNFVLLQYIGMLDSHRQPLAQSADHTTESAMIHSQARDTIQQEMSAAAAEGRPPRRGAAAAAGGAAGAKYSRLDSDTAAMQRDSSTYCDEPDDSAAYSAWLQVLLQV